MHETRLHVLQRNAAPALRSVLTFQMVIFFLSQTQISCATWSMSRKSCETSCIQHTRHVRAQMAVRSTQHEELATLAANMLSVDGFNWCICSLDIGLKYQRRIPVAR